MSNYIFDILFEKNTCELYHVVCMTRLMYEFIDGTRGRKRTVYFDRTTVYLSKRPRH